MQTDNDHLASVDVLDSVNTTSVISLASNDDLRCNTESNLSLTSPEQSLVDNPAIASFGSNSPAPMNSYIAPISNILHGLQDRHDDNILTSAHNFLCSAESQSSRGDFDLLKQRQSQHVVYLNSSEVSSQPPVFHHGRKRTLSSIDGEDVGQPGSATSSRSASQFLQDHLEPAAKQENISLCDGTPSLVHNPSVGLNLHGIGHAEAEDVMGDESSEVSG